RSRSTRTCLRASSRGSWSVSQGERPPRMRSLLVERDDVAGWLLNEQDRATLLARIPARYERLVAHHVTLKPHADPEENAPPVQHAEVVGVADDGMGVQALVVRLDGTTARPDGGVFHITWSLEPGRRAVESNSVIAEHGWTA